jgi:hypothetical protein
MRGSTDIAWLSDVRSRRTFYRFEIVCQDQPLEMKLESIPDCSYSEMYAVRGPFFGTRFGHLSSLVFLSSSLVAAFRAFNFRQQIWGVFGGFAAGKRNRHTRSTPFSCNFSKYPPGFFLRG